MNKCIDIFNKNKGESVFGASIYIDPVGYEYDKSIVTCRSCMFNLGHESCLLFKETGEDEQRIQQKMQYVANNNECEYFLKKDFSENNNDDKIAREEVMAISQQINYPAEYWRRHKIHQVMEEKNIGQMTIENQSCMTCKYCEQPYNEISYCQFHQIELFVDKRNCNKYHVQDSLEVSENPTILITAALYEKGDTTYPISDNYSLLARSNHTFEIIRINDSCQIFTIEPYLLNSVLYNKDDGYIYANYVFKVVVFDPNLQKIVDTIIDEKEKEKGREVSWLNCADKDYWYSQIDQVILDQSLLGVSISKSKTSCQRCEHKVRNNQYPDGSPTGLLCSLKQIFVSANGICDDFS